MLDYDQLDRIFSGTERAPELVSEPLELARRAAAALAEGRPRGALEVESFEPEFEFDSDGAVVRAHSVPQTEAHQLIEHLMILTNEQVAQLLERKKVPTLYRIHEQPDPARVRFRLKQPWPDFMTFYASATGAGWIVPKKYVEKVGDDGFKKHPIGAGPYRFVSYTPGVELVLEAVEQYWRRTPQVKRLLFKAIPDP